MSVVSHSYGGLGGGMDGVAVCKHTRQSQQGSIVCRKMPKHIPSARREHRCHPIIQPSRYVAASRVEPEFVGHLGKTLTRDATRRLRLDVHANGRLNSMVLHGRNVCSCHAAVWSENHVSHRSPSWITYY